MEGHRDTPYAPEASDPFAGDDWWLWMESTFMEPGTLSTSFDPSLGMRELPCDIGSFSFPLDLTLSGAIPVMGNDGLALSHDTVPPDNIDLDGFNGLRNVSFDASPVMNGGLFPFDSSALLDAIDFGGHDEVLAVNYSPMAVTPTSSSIAPLASLDSTFSGSPTYSYTPLTSTSYSLSTPQHSPGSAWNRPTPLSSEHEMELAVQAALTAGTPAVAAARLSSVKPGLERRKHIRRARGDGRTKRQQRYDERPEKCEWCGKGHAFNAELTRHMRAQHKDKMPAPTRHACQVDGCSKTFARSDHLRRHERRRHGGDAPREGSREMNDS